MAEIGITPILRDIANSINLYTGREGLKTIIPNTISPIIDVYKAGDLLLIYDDQAVGSTGQESFFAVPDNEVWTLHYVHAYVSSGTFTMGGIKVIPPPPKSMDLNQNSSDPKKWVPYSPANAILYWYYQGSANPLVVDCDKGASPIRLPGNWAVDITIDSYSSAGTIKMYGIISREIY